MKKISMLAISLLALNCHAQTGIQFIKEANWQSVLKRAQVENKYIFVDAYTTWCGPCKMMDSETYTDTIVGALANAKFLSIKVQMDSIKNDNQFVKNWYADAASFKYAIQAYPTFLFFSSDGKLIQRDMGFRNSKEFLSILNKVLDPKGSYLNQIQEYEKGNLNSKQLFQLAFLAKNNKNDSLALRIAKVYKAKFIDQKDPKEILSPDLPKFFQSFDALFRFNEPIINYLFVNPDASDKMMGIYAGYAKGFIDYIIKRDFIMPTVYPEDKAATMEPDWRGLSRTVKKLIGEKIAERLILDMRMSWNRDKGNWEVVVNYELKKLNTIGLDTSGDVRSNINDVIYSVVFMHSTTPSVLKKGMMLTESILKYEPENYHFLDTYANILYKAGYKDKAIKASEKAFSLAQKDKYQRHLNRFQETIDKMKNNQSTWTTDK